MTIFLIVPAILVGIVCAIFIGALITQNFVYTPPFKGPDGKPLPGSISEFRRIKLGGYSQAILIRGKNVANPIMLFLHAGPGLSETGLYRNFHAILENYYTMVYLDQRGAGKSYSLFLNANTFTTEQLLQDIHELTTYLKKRFGKEKIAIMGHSFGAGFAAVAAAQHAENYSVFIGIGQPVCIAEIDRLSYAWTLEQARANDNQKALEELGKIDGYWLKKEKQGYFSGMMVNKKWVGYYGGQIQGQTSFVSYVLKNSLCHEFTIFDYAPYLLGMLFSGPASWKIMTTTDLRKQAPEFHCPVILLAGRHDYNAVPSLVEEYYNSVKAPLKKIFWFERSAHFPNFEEPELYHKIMISEILPIIKGKSVAD